MSLQIIKYPPHQKYMKNLIDQISGETVQQKSNLSLRAFQLEKCPFVFGFCGSTKQDFDKLAEYLSKKVRIPRIKTLPNPITIGLEDDIIRYLLENQVDLIDANPTEPLMIKIYGFGNLDLWNSTQNWDRIAHDYAQDMVEPMSMKGYIERAGITPSEGTFKGLKKKIILFNHIDISIPIQNYDRAIFSATHSRFISKHLVYDLRHKE